MYLRRASVLRTPAASSYSMGTRSSHMLTGWMTIGSPFIFLQPAGERSPHAGNVELAVDDVLHLPPRLVLGVEVGVVAERLQLEVGREAALGQHLADARGLEDADLEALQRRVVETLDVEPAVVAIGEHVGRAVDGDGGQRRLVHRGQVEQHVAHVGVERLARQAALEIRAPEIDRAWRRAPWRAPRRSCSDSRRR